MTSNFIVYLNVLKIDYCRKNLLIWIVDQVWIRIIERPIFCSQVLQVMNDSLDSKFLYCSEQLLFQPHAKLERLFQIFFATHAVWNKPRRIVGSHSDQRNWIVLCSFLLC